MTYHWDFNFILSFIPALGKGLWVTVYISLISIILGSLLGVLVALARKSQHYLIRGLSAIYINLFLAFPVLVLMVWLYYCLPVIIPVRLSATWTAILALSLSLAGFVGDIIRGGMDSLPKGQLESALILGISKRDAMRRIILPQAVRIMIPPILGQYITCMKLSALASIISVYEILHTANNIIMHSYRPLETYTVVSMLYILIVWPLVRLMRYLEKQCLRVENNKYEADKLMRFFQWFRSA